MQNYSRYIFRSSLNGWTELFLGALLLPDLELAKSVCPMSGQRLISPVYSAKSTSVSTTTSPKIQKKTRLIETNKSADDIGTVNHCQDACNHIALIISSSRLQASPCFQICCGPCLWYPSQDILAGLGLAKCQGIAQPQDQGKTIFVFLPCSTGFKKKKN